MEDRRYHPAARKYEELPEGGMNMNTCGECYWYSDITVRTCDREKEPTSEEQEACPLFEPKEE